MMPCKARCVVVVLLLVLIVTACGPGPTPTADTATPTEEQAASAPASSPTPTPTPTPLPPTATLTEAEAPSTPTPTPTPPPALASTATLEPAESPCAGLSGEIETQVLVGPADAVGLEPLAVGQIPFAVTTGEAPYLVAGAGHTSYADVLTEQWGTYDVTLELDNTVSGECVENDGAAQLNLNLVSSGEQMVIVDAGEFYGEYPWSGTNSFNLSFPAVEGATVEGDGWAYVLHLGQP